MKFVYFISAGPFIKIGLSKAPFGRVESLQPWCPYTLELELVVPGTPGDEAAFHWLFLEYRVRGEWFRHEGRLKEFLGRYEAISLDPETEAAVLAEANAVWKELADRGAADEYRRKHARNYPGHGQMSVKPLGPREGELLLTEFCRGGSNS